MTNPDHYGTVNTDGSRSVSQPIAAKPDQVVTDEMVDAGAKAIHQEGWHPSTGRMLARKCLEAALGAKP
jgi:hypothetical protein